MTNSLVLNVNPSDQSSLKFVIKIFQEHVFSKLENLLLWSVIHINFKNWTENIWEKLNGNTWSIIRRYNISCNIWIDEFEDNLTWSDILLKLILIKNNKELKDWAIDNI